MGWERRATLALYLSSAWRRRSRRAICWRRRRKRCNSLCNPLLSYLLIHPLMIWIFDLFHCMHTTPIKNNLLFWWKTLSMWLFMEGHSIPLILVISPSSTSYRTLSLSKKYGCCLRGIEKTRNWSFPWIKDSNSWRKYFVLKITKLKSLMRRLSWARRWTEWSRLVISSSTWKKIIQTMFFTLWWVAIFSIPSTHGTNIKSYWTMCLSLYFLEKGIRWRVPTCPKTTLFQLSNPWK